MKGKGSAVMGMGLGNFKWGRLEDRELLSNRREKGFSYEVDERGEGVS